MAAAFQTLGTREIEEAGSGGEAFVSPLGAQQSDCFVPADVQAPLGHIQRGHPVCPLCGLLAVVPWHQQALGLTPKQGPPGKLQTGATPLSVFLAPFLGEHGGALDFCSPVITAGGSFRSPVLLPPAFNTVPPPTIAVLGSVHLFPIAL